MFNDRLLTFCEVSCCINVCVTCRITLLLWKFYIPVRPHHKNNPLPLFKRRYSLWSLELGLSWFHPFFFFFKQSNPSRTFFFFLINQFIYFWLFWVFVSVWGLPPVAASGGHSSSRCAGLSLSRPLLLRSTGSRRAGSVIVAHGPSRSTACGIFPDQGSNPCPLHWQADSQPLRHQGSPISPIFTFDFGKVILSSRKQT